MSKRAFRVRLTVEGLNQLRLIKTLTDAGVRVYDVQKLKIDCLKMTIKSKDKAKTFAILQKLCYNYCIEWDFSIKSQFINLAKRSGAVLGFALGIGLCLVASLAVTRVKASGLDSLTNQVVSSLVADEFDVPAFKSQINKQAIKSAVLSMQEVADCNVSIKGNCIFIEVMPADKRAESHPDPVSIISSDDAIITRTVIREGRSLVKIGDVVKAGETLVDGKIYDSTGQNEIGSVAPDAEVYGEVVERKTVVVPRFSIEKRYTGRTVKESRLTLPWQSVTERSPYASFDRRMGRARLGLILPLTYEIVTYRETEFVKTENDVNRIAEELLQEMTTQGAGGIKSTKTDVVDLGGEVKRISVYVVREKQIGVGIGEL